MQTAAAPTDAENKKHFISKVLKSYLTTHRLITHADMLAAQDGKDEAGKEGRTLEITYI